MRVGCPKEIKNNEYRVGLTPSATREYVGHGHQVIIETGAGAGIVVDSEGCAIKQTFSLEGVKFDFNAATLTPNAEIVLQDVIDTLAGQPSMTVQVAGHTDSKGLAAYNVRLSEERAVSVKEFLVENGIDAGRLTAIGYGESQPIADNGTEDGREANRRVEFSVTSK